MSKEKFDGNTVRLGLVSIVTSMGTTPTLVGPGLVQDHANQGLIILLGDTAAGESGPGIVLQADIQGRYPVGTFRQDWPLNMFMPCWAEVKLLNSPETPPAALEQAVPVPANDGGLSPTAGYGVAA